MGAGMMQQPALAKIPPYTMEEDNRILTKTKLDELVRQVTGSMGMEGQGLAPDVESVSEPFSVLCLCYNQSLNIELTSFQSVFEVCDNFIDQVLQSACKNAKERGSKLLEIRDIQLALERGYNIRIPGYASDEIRTVRKIQPSPAWISKMSAVQAAKVTGGRGSE